MLGTCVFQKLLFGASFRESFETFGKVSKLFRKLLYQMGGARCGMWKVLGIANTLALQRSFADAYFRKNVMTSRTYTPQAQASEQHAAQCHAKQIVENSYVGIMVSRRKVYRISSAHVA